MARRLRGWGAGVCLLAASVGAARASAADGDPASQYQWGLDQSRVRASWSVGEGEGTVIAVVDTGVELGHEDLAAHLVAGHNVLDPSRRPQDDHGRGTHVAGIAAAIRDNGKGVAGVAPEARIMPIKALGSDGLGTSENVALGVRWAADHGADVIEVTLGDTIPTFVGSGLRDAVRYAWSKGSIPVISAGPRVRYTPGFSDEPAIVVAATTRTQTDPAYESEVGGARWGMAAPGGARSGNDDDDVLSTYWPHSETVDGQSRQYGRYRYLSGTAMAAGHVAGAAAVLRGLGLEPQQVVDRLLVTARDIGASGRDNVFGAGLLDLQAATAGMRPRATTTTTTSDPGGTSSTTVVADDGAVTTTTTTEPERRPTTTLPPTTAAGPPGAEPPPAPVSTSTTVVAAGPAGSGGGVPWVPLVVAGVVGTAGSTVAVMRRRAASRVT